MRQHGYIGSFAIVMALSLAPARASAQAMLADDIIILSKGREGAGEGTDKQPPRLFARSRRAVVSAKPGWRRTATR